MATNESGATRNENTELLIRCFPVRAFERRQRGVERCVGAIGARRGIDGAVASRCTRGVDVPNHLGRRADSSRQQQE